MTSHVFFDALTSIVDDLSQDIPPQLRYQRLLDAMQRCFPCNAAALLRLEDKHLAPLAVDGLSTDTMGRRFAVDENPRLARLLHAREPVRFAAESKLPDPYDGLVETNEMDLDVHDCMGCSLYIDDQPWGVLTLDAIQPGTFDSIDPIELRTFISLTEATVKAARRIRQLEERVVKENEVTRALIEDCVEAELIGKSNAIEQMRNEIKTVAQSDLTVLVLGETGVGKELVARKVHCASPRSSHPLIYVNCAALPENIAESELFGHVKGAFTGAISSRAGKFEIADGGTLFLDEIGELSLTTQAKLLRVLQSGEIQRVGSDQYIQVDARIVTATNRDLQQEVLNKRFRADLYHRLSVYPITVPPLRERGYDVLLLSGFFLENNQRRLGVNALRLSPAAKTALQQYQWPGNVRELEHLLSRASLKAMAEQGRDAHSITIKTGHLDLDLDLGDTVNIAAEARPQQVELPEVKISLKEATDQFQRQLISNRLEKYQGNLAAAGNDLGVNRSNFYRLLARLKMRQ